MPKTKKKSKKKTVVQVYNSKTKRCVKGTIR